LFHHASPFAVKRAFSIKNHNFRATAYFDIFQNYRNIKQKAFPPWAELIALTGVNCQNLRFRRYGYKVYDGMGVRSIPFLSVYRVFVYPAHPP